MIKYILLTLAFFFFLLNYSFAQNALCLDVEIGLDEFGQAVIDPFVIDAGSTGSGVLTYNVTPSIVDCGNIGLVNVLLTIVDETGATDECSANVFVGDFLQPTMLCNNFDWTINEIILPELAGMAIDNCSITETMVLPNSFDQPGNYSVTLVAFDAGGNANTCISFVNIEVDGLDTDSPTISQCADVNLLIETDAFCEYVLPDYTNLIVAADNVTNTEDLVISQSPIAGTVILGNSLQTITFTVTDEAGLSATCASFIEPLDVIAPTILNCPNDMTFELEGTYVLPDFTTEIGSYDNCSDNFDLVAYQSPAPGFQTDFPNLYEIIVTAEDESGNAATCNFTIDLIEEVEFSVKCQDINVFLDESGNASVEPSDVDGGSTGNWDFEYALSQTEFNCSDIGINLVQLTVSGGPYIGTCDAVVSVLDSIAPVVICQDLSVFLESNGTVTISPLDIDNGSTDNCIMLYTSGNAEFNSSNLGSNTIVLTVIDFVGNTGSCEAIVTVYDDPGNMVLCIDASIELDATGNASITVADVDAGTQGNIESMILDIEDFNCNNVGSNTTVLTASFENGDVSTCTSIVTVEDNTNPTVTCQNISIQLDAEGEASIVAHNIELSAQDNCGISLLTISQTDFIEEDLGDNDVELTATDNNGNSASCTAIVSVNTFAMPIFTCPGDMSLDGNVDCSLELPDFQSQCTTINFCDEPSLEYTQIPAPGTLISGTTTVDMTVNDVCGNVNTCSFSVAIDDFSVEIEVENGTLFTTIEANNYQWYDCNGNAIIDANMASYTPVESGSYNISVIANSCSGSSGCIVVTVAGIDESELENNLVLYPNPNIGTFKINLGSKDYQNIEINILNELGQLVYLQNAEHQRVLNIAVDHLPSGIYFLSVISNNARATRSFVIE